MKRFLTIFIVAACVIATAYYFRNQLAEHLPPQYAAYLKPKADAPAGQPSGKVAPGGAQSGAQPGGRRGGGTVAVQVVEAKSGSLPILRNSFGYIEARDTTSLASPIAGIVATVEVEDGAEVRKGDLIVTYDKRALEATLAKDKATMAKDQATYDNAESTLKRTTNLGEKGASTQQAIDNANAALKQAEAALALDRAQIEADMVAISNSQIKAPYDGKLGAITVSPGSYVGAGTAVTTIVATDQIYAQFTLPEADLRLVRGALARDELTAAVRPTNASDGTAEVVGKVAFIDNEVDQTSGTFRLWATLDNSKRVFWPGESVSVTVTAGQLDNLVLVPNVAVSPMQNGDGAFVVTADNKADLRMVTVALRSGGMTGISKGVSAGDKVVVEGQLSLGRGTPVKITDGKPKAQGGKKPERQEAEAAKPGQNGQKAD